MKVQAPLILSLQFALLWLVLAQPRPDADARGQGSASHGSISISARQLDGNPGRLSRPNATWPNPGWG